MQFVVITGASTGIGLASVRALIARDIHVFASVRKAADADRLVAEFGPAYLTPLLFDVTDQAAIAAAAEIVRARLGQQNLLGLVNNAGIAVGGPLVHLPLAEFRRQLEVNLVSALGVTQAFVPLLGMEPNRTGAPGRIINMSSVAGRIATPFIGAYCASKHGLEALTDALRRELMIYGIDAIAIGPGFIETPIWDKAEAEDISHFDKTDFKPALDQMADYFRKQRLRGLPASRVGELVCKALLAKRPRPRYAIARGGWFATGLPPLLPKRFIDRAIAKLFGIKRLTR